MLDALNPRPLLDLADNHRALLLDLEERTQVQGDALSHHRSRLARLLAEGGIESGDRVLFSVRNGPLFLLGFAALLERGASPLLMHADTPYEELARIARTYDAAWALLDRASVPDVAAATVHQPAPWATYWQVPLLPDRFRGSEYPRLPGVPLHPTSGTTGTPKLAVRPAAAAVAEATHYVETIGIDASDRVLSVAPMTHAYAFGTGAMVPLIAQCSVASIQSFNPRILDRALEELDVTVLFAVPAMLDILARRRTASRCHPRLRVFSAGSPLPSTVSQAFEQAYGVAPRPLYGTTETGGIAVAPSGTTGAEVGPPMRGVMVGLTAAERGEAELKDGGAGGLGRLWVRSASMMTGYLTRSGIDTSAVEDGAFDTADLATMDPVTGSISLFGRQSEVINVFGMKVIPSEVESVLRALPFLSDVVVYAGTHRSGSQIVQAAIVATSPDVDISVVRAHCEQHLAHYKRPQRFHLLARLPRTASGKVIRSELP